MASRSYRTLHGLRWLPSVVALAACRTESVSDENRSSTSAATTVARQWSHVEYAGGTACASSAEEWWCWGYTEPKRVDRGEAGDVVEFETRTPHEVTWMHGAVDVTVGPAMCALFSDGRLECLGGGFALGQEYYSASSAMEHTDPKLHGAIVPTRMRTPKAVSLDPGTCVVNEQHEAYCFGSLPGEEYTSPGRRIDGLPPVAHCAVTNQTACFQAINGEVWCFDARSPRPSRVLDSATTLAAVFSHVCALRRGEVFCWGNDWGDHGHFGPPQADEPRGPSWHAVTKIPYLPKGQSLWGQDSACISTSDARGWCWGGRDLSFGHVLGTIPTPRPWLTGIEHAKGDDINGCGTRADGRVVCWSKGQATVVDLPYGGESHE